MNELNPSPAEPVRRVRLAAFALLALLAVSLLAASASHARPFDIGFADNLYEGPTSQQALKQTKSVNADIIRVNMGWRQVAVTQPADPRDPADPSYDWTGIDRAISNADSDGFEIDLTIFSAPDWAEGPNRPDDFDVSPPGSWKPDAGMFGDFAHAVAERYSGDYSVDGKTLPAVKYFEAWNEPNLSTYITPQWNGKKNVASDLYQALLNSFYDEVKRVNPKAKIVSGGTAPYGDPPGGPNRTQPLRFMQEVLCLKPNNKKGDCPNGEPSKFDIYAHHPINREDAPTDKADNKGDIEVADFGTLTKTLKKADKMKTPGTPGRHQIWANEVWWQTNPPDRDEGVSLKTQARYYAQTLYLLWKQGASNVSFLQLFDAKYTPGEFTLASYQTGVFTDKGKRKPSADAVAFPFVTDPKGKKLLAWGRSPKSGQLTVEAKGKGGGGFKKVARFRVKGGKIFTHKLNLSGKAKLRAKVGKETSEVWKQG